MGRIRGMTGIGTQWAIRVKALIWTMPIPQRNERGDASPKAHTSYATEDKHYPIHVEEECGVGVVEMAWE